MGVIYDNIALIPAPLAEYRRVPHLTGDGTPIGYIFEITISGTFLPNKGSPQSGSLSGAGWGGPSNLFWISSGYPPDESISLDHRLYAIEAKQAAVRDLFSKDGLWLEFQSPDGSIPLKCQPRFKDVVLNRDTWAVKCDYVIVLEADIMYLNGTPQPANVNVAELVSAANENWDLSDGEVAKTYRLSHTMSAVGKRQFDTQGNQVGLAWQNAQQFIQNRLGPGFNTTTGFSPIPGNQIVASSFLNNGSVIDLSTLTAYDFARLETIDEWAGSYSLTESWLLATAASGTDVYTITVHKMSEAPETTTEVAVQGLIKGFYTGLNDYNQRYSAAQYVWNQLDGANLYNRVQSYASGISLNQQALTGSVDYNPTDGTISYNYQFSDRIASSGDIFEEYVVSKNVSQSDYKTTISIDGRIIGRRYETDTDPNLKFNRAFNVWQTLLPFPAMYNKVVGLGMFPEVVDLKQNPVTQKVDMDKVNGVISYSYEFNNRKNDNDLNDENVYEEYGISSEFNRENGFKTYSIQGTIEGLNNLVTGSGAREAKINSAKNYWNLIAPSSLLNRVLTIAGTLNNQTPIESEYQQSTNGTISYTYRYTTEPVPYASGALSEILTVVNNNSNGTVNIFGRVPVPGRTQGPVLQDMSTTPEKVRQISIETVFPCAQGGNILNDINPPFNYDPIVAQLVPNAGTIYRDEDVYTWTPRTGRYTRSVQWTYQ